MTKKEIGKVLQKLRMDTGKTQKEVAELIGRKQQIIGHWETGYSQPDANTLFELCELYGVTVDEAFEFKNKGNELSQHEKKLIKAYREKEEMREAVDILLQIDSKSNKDFGEETAALEKTSYLSTNTGEIGNKKSLQSPTKTAGLTG